jgi:ferritin-like metal-binding protein YciE
MNKKVLKIFHTHITLNAERQLLEALPKLAKASSSETLQAAFEEHTAVTEHHVGRLETIFKSLDKAARGKHCPGNGRAHYRGRRTY